MTPEMVALARRAVVCKGWRWLPGMLTLDGFRCVWADAEQIECAASRAHNFRRPNSATDLPDLTDPATLGCLLALVREAHAVPFLQVSVKISREHGYQFDCHPHHRGQWVDSEAEALVAALEDAP